jgi:hypothetical protein
MDTVCLYIDRGGLLSTYLMSNCLKLVIKNGQTVNAYDICNRKQLNNNSIKIPYDNDRTSRGSSVVTVITTIRHYYGTGSDVFDGTALLYPTVISPNKQFI